MSREEDQEAGELVASILRSRVWIDHAWTMHADVISALEGSGFDVTPEYQVRLPNGRGGRIDIVADYGGGGRVAIELDARKPRWKSVEKLKAIRAFRIVGLRGVEGHEEVGIDLCVPMRVRKATKEHKADRRVYRPAPDWAQDWKGA